MAYFAYSQPRSLDTFSLVREARSAVSPTEDRPVFRQHLRRRERLPLDSEALWKIESGFFRSLTWDEEGDVTTLGIWGPGDRISIAFSTIFPLNLECLTPACVCQVTDVASDSPEFMQFKAQRTEELLYFLQIRCTQTRLRHILYWLAQRFGRSIESGILLPLRLTHQELADLIGSTRVTVTRLMNQLEKQGEFESCGRHLILHG